MFVIYNCTNDARIHGHQVYKPRACKMHYRLVFCPIYMNCGNKIYVLKYQTVFVRGNNPMTTAVTYRGLRPYSLQNALKLDNPEFVVNNNQISIVVVT